MNQPSVGYCCKTREPSESSSRDCLCRMHPAARMILGADGGGQECLHVQLQGISNVSTKEEMIANHKAGYQELYLARMIEDPI